METDYVNGEIVLLGALHNIDVRHNRAAVICAHRMARERLVPGTLSIADLRGMVSDLSEKER